MAEDCLRTAENVLGEERQPSPRRPPPHPEVAARLEGASEAAVGPELPRREAGAQQPRGLLEVEGWVQGRQVPHPVVLLVVAVVVAVLLVLRRKHCSRQHPGQLVQT